MIASQMQRASEFDATSTTLPGMLHCLLIASVLLPAADNPNGFSPTHDFALALWGCRTDSAAQTGLVKIKPRPTIQPRIKPLASRLNRSRQAANRNNPLR